jgi:hypothetical protein
MEETQQDIKGCLKSIFEPQIRKATNRNELPTIYGIVKHVSQSGMMRHITFFTIVDNKPIELDWYISTLLDYKRVKGSSGLKVQGCGMDMVFSVVYNLGCALWNNEEAKALGFVSGRNGDTTPECDGGYLLNTGHI